MVVGQCNAHVQQCLDQAALVRLVLQRAPDGLARWEDDIAAGGYHANCLAIFMQLAFALKHVKTRIMMKTGVVFTTQIMADKPCSLQACF